MLKFFLFIIKIKDRWNQLEGFFISHICTSRHTLLHLSLFITLPQNFSLTTLNFLFHVISFRVFFVSFSSFCFTALYEHCYCTVVCFSQNCLFFQHFKIYSDWWMNFLCFVCFWVNAKTLLLFVSFIISVHVCCFTKIKDWIVAVVLCL